MKIFGKELFNFKRKVKPSEMYDFAQHGVLSGSYNTISNYISFDGGTATPARKVGRPSKKNKTTPKKLFKMGALNDNKFSINVSKMYLSEQIKDLEDKLLLYPKRKDILLKHGIKYGKSEVLSIIERLKNRRKIKEFQKIVDKYPHTSSELINKVVGTHDHLKCKKADDFIPDFPKDAVKAMHEYNDMCKKLCNKITHFYVIGDEKDFEVQDKKRDPILLAQSPFGFFWQILGAWSDEMIYLGDL